MPQMKVHSRDLDRQHDMPAGHLESATGVTSRYYCTGESQIDLAVEASRRALQDADVEASEVDLIISGCGIPYQTLPSTAPLVQKELGIGNGMASAFDVNSTCLSFLNALDYAAHLLTTGSFRTALLFSADIASRALPWREAPEVAGLFGDGAAAVVIRRTSGPDNRTFHMRTYPSAYDACQIAAGGTRFDFHKDNREFAENTVFKMNGTDLFRITVANFSKFVDETLAAARWSKSEVDLVIPHQASPHALSHMIRLTGFDAGKVVNIASEYGNQIAASIPTCLDLAIRQGRIERGCKLLFLGTSAGVSLGGMTFEF